MDTPHELFNLRIAVYLVFVALAYMGILLTLMLRFAKSKGKTMLKNEGAVAFRDQAQELLRKAEYEALKELALERQRRYPADSGLHYYLGMAYFRCKEYVEAKACFTTAMTLDSQWKTLCLGHLAEVEAELKKLKPSIVE